MTSSTCKLWPLLAQEEGRPREDPAEGEGRARAPGRDSSLIPALHGITPGASVDHSLPRVLPKMGEVPLTEDEVTRESSLHRSARAFGCLGGGVVESLDSAAVGVNGMVRAISLCREPFILY